MSVTIRRPRHGLEPWLLLEEILAHAWTGSVLAVLIRWLEEHTGYSVAEVVNILMTYSLKGRGR